jgi:hypothetical protein
MFCADFTKTTISRSLSLRQITRQWTARSLIYAGVIDVYATSFCINWAFLIARGTRLKHERSEGFKASGANRKTQFPQKRVAYKILLFETTFLKLPNLF